MFFRNLKFYMQLYYCIPLICINIHAGPGINSEHDFEGFIHFGNRVKMTDVDFDSLERLVEKHMPAIPFYISTIKKSNTVKNKAKMVNNSVCINLSYFYFV